MATVFREKKHYLKKDVLVGCYLPRREIDRLTLHALLHGVSKSNILEEMIMDYIDKLPEVDDLINQAVTKALNDWKQKQIENIGQEGWQSVEKVTARWEAYKVDLFKDLKMKKIPKNLVNIIMNEIEREM